MINSGASDINIPSVLFPASSIDALVNLPLLTFTSTITFPTLFHSQTLSSGDAKFTSSTPSKVEIHCTHAPTQKFVDVPLPYTLPFSLKVQIYSSWYILITSNSLSTLTLISVTSRELFIATLMNMILNYTPRNTYFLVPSCSKNIPRESTDQELQHLTQRSV